jgi:electron transfer flavoprotein beta subunit
VRGLLAESGIAAPLMVVKGDGSLVGADGSRVECGDFHDPPAKAAGQIIEDEDTDETVEKIVAWLDERKLI